MSQPHPVPGDLLSVKGSDYYLQVSKVVPAGMYCYTLYPWGTQIGNLHFYPGEFEESWNSMCRIFSISVLSCKDFKL